MPSTEFQRFIESFERPSVGSDGVEEIRVATLAGGERKQAEDMLLARLVKENDPRIPRALADMGSKRAAMVLRNELARTVSDETKVSAAVALWRLERDKSAVDALADILRTATREEVRIAATNALRELRDTQADDALIDAAARDDGARSAATYAIFE